QVVDRRALHQGIDEADAELVGVRHGKYGQQAVLGPDQHDEADRPAVVDDVAMAEHDALGAARRARGVDDGRQILAPDLGQGEAGRRRVHGGRGRKGVTGRGQDGPEILERDEDAARRRQVRLCEAAAGDEEDAALGMIEDGGDLLAREVGEYRDDDAGGAGNPQIGDAPFGAALRENRHAVARRRAEEAQECGNAAGHGLELLVAYGRPARRGEGREARVSGRALFDYLRYREAFQFVHVLFSVRPSARVNAFLSWGR